MNGWQRAFVMGTVIWGLICLFGVTFFLVSDPWIETSLTGNQFLGLPSVDIWGYGISIWVGPCILLYLFGLGVAWVRRGFKNQ